LSEPAFYGARKLLDYFIDAARTSKQYFVAGPVWNQLDRLVVGETQYLRYAFDGIDTREVPFSTTDLEKYGSGDAGIESMLKQKVDSLLTPN
jgi:hypothetical protein